MIRAAVGAALALLATAPPALAGPPALDPGFGAGAGWVRTLEAPGNILPRGAEDVAVQPDGRAVVAGPVQDGRSNRYFGAFRYLPDGSLDPSFRVTADLGSFEESRAVALQRDGRIVIAGETDCETARCFAAMRVLPDGTPDPGFGDGGVVRVEFPLRASWANDVAIDGKGRIVLAGVRLRGGDAQDSATVCVLRLLPDGGLDPAFSRDGVAIVDHGYGNDSAESLLVRGGRITVAGQGRSSYRSFFGLARLRENGAPDRSFGRRGGKLVGFGERRLASAYGLAAGRRGQLLVAGSAVIRDRRPQIAFARLRRDGAVLSRARTWPGPSGGYATAVRAHGDGALVAGRVFADDAMDASDWTLARYGARGRLDRAFGVARTDFGTGADQANALALVPGAAVVAGEIYSSHGLARYVIGAGGD